MQFLPSLGGVLGSGWVDCLLHEPILLIPAAAKRCQTFAFAMRMFRGTDTEHVHFLSLPRKVWVPRASCLTSHALLEILLEISLESLSKSSTMLVRIRSEHLDGLVKALSECNVDPMHTEPCLVKQITKLEQACIPPLSASGHAP